MFLAEALSAQEIAYIVMITSAFEAKHSINVALVLFKHKKHSQPSPYRADSHVSGVFQGD